MAHVLEAEPCTRIVLTACRLAQSVQKAGHAPIALPLFDFWLSSLQTALDEDQFWGPTFWKDLEPRASNLEHGIYHMVRQCIDFENMGQSGNGTPQISRYVMTPPVGPPASPTRLGAYQSDGQKVFFVGQASSRMHEIVLGCWTSILADAANVGHPIDGLEVQASPNSLRSSSY